ncbi:MAG: hypothetical protein U9N59_03230, partial [Campylobacterota bacterium]|nr:hypothetical protein [Campylobacterota bacterium]
KINNENYNNESFDDLMQLAINDKVQVEKLADNGDLLAQKVLYSFYSQGGVILASNMEQFLYYTKLAAHQGDPLAQATYARSIFQSIEELKDGKSVPLTSVVSVKKRIEESLYWYKKAHENGISETIKDINQLETNFLEDWINPVIAKHGLICLNRLESDVEVEDKLILISLSEEMLVDMYKNVIYLKYCYDKANKSKLNKDVHLYKEAVIEMYAESIYICELLHEKGISEFDAIALMSSFYLVHLSIEISKHVNNISDKDKIDIVNSLLLVIDAKDMVNTSSYIELIRMGACWLLRHQYGEFLPIQDKESIINEKKRQ